MKDSTTFSRLVSFFCLRSELVAAKSSRNWPASFGRSMPASNSWIASAPIMAVNESSPYSSMARK